MSLELFIFVFVLAMFLGIELIRKVPGNLHTPLMSGSNAISGISVIGAMVALASGAATGSNAALFFGAAAIGFAAVNVVGGYFVTDRMLKMFGGSRPAGEASANGRKGGAR